MRIINGWADRLLSVVVPKITAGACCPPDTTIQFCYCVSHEGYAYGRYCSYNCACQISCSTCGDTVYRYQGCS
jgi:hypothetical protein